jgi:hypothetical protein
VKTEEGAEVKGRERRTEWEERREADVAWENRGDDACRAVLWLESGGGELEEGGEAEDDDDIGWSGCDCASARLGGRDGAKLRPGDDEELSDSESDDTVGRSDVRHDE